MTTTGCPACNTPVLIVQGSRHGGLQVPFDPEPGISEHFDTVLSGDLSHVARAAADVEHLRGRIPMYRAHQWTCREGMRIPADKPLPLIGGYSHKAAPRKGAAPAAEPSWPQPWEGISGTVRDDLGDLLSLAGQAMPRRRVMVMMGMAAYRTASGQAARRMQSPRPGDLVIETASARKPDGEREGLGILIAARRELAGTEPGSRAAADALYIQYGPGEGDVARWDTGALIAVLASDRAFDE